jgi:hypothetical protein
MSRRRAPDVNLVVVAATIALAAGAAMFVALTYIAYPSHYDARLGAVSEQADAAEALLQAPGLVAYPSGAVCKGAAENAAMALSQRLHAAAARAGVNLVSAQVDPSVASRGAEGLAPVAVTLEVNGRYDSVIAMLGGLARTQPELFVDNVDLRSLTSAVDLKLSGKILCSTSDHL